MPKIEFDKEACVGCAACTCVCDNWVMEGDKAKPKKTSISKEELAKNKEAEDTCPVNCIKVIG